MTDRQLRILFVEDELNLAEIVRESLESRGFQVTHLATASTALEAYYNQKPDILILDVMLPDADGFALARQIRATDMDTPVIFLTSRSLPQDVVTGFESGGNDYLKKPFSMEELVVRIKALTSKSRTLFREMADPDAPVIIGSQYAFHYRQALLKRNEVIVSLTAREAELLKLFLLNRNQVMDRKSILLHIWGNDDFFTGRSLDVFITRLRKYLQHDPEVRIMNIRGVGYKLIG
ncbi:response regulator transcription factor [Pseudoflavitalea sp. X16]|uniref:response regulator transcription factor n=1 Tax=Paraflavitalea devenefica TaxID=2716334 RepID=UPI001420F2F6|nr:response regulator transcription factor [Paraflavitalea devenefica]NII25322.1 response regulator transcription factor [Paraflavitalea devenefica]